MDTIHGYTTYILGGHTWYILRSYIWNLATPDIVGLYDIVYFDIVCLFDIENTVFDIKILSFDIKC